MKMILSPFYCTLIKAVLSPVGFVKSRKSMKEISVAHEGLACGYGRHFALRMLNRIGVDSIGSMPHRESSFSSCECGNAILQYC